MLSACAATLFCIQLVILGLHCAGPGADDSYADLRSDYQKNEVAVDYNAGFTGQLSGATALSKTTLHLLLCRLPIAICHFPGCSFVGEITLLTCSAGVLAYLSQSTDTYQACLSRGDIVHQIVAQTNNQT